MPPRPDSEAGDRLQRVLGPALRGGWVPEQPAFTPDQAPETVDQVLRIARFDPGRRGVLALALVGLIASLVASAVLLRSQAREQPLLPPPVVGASASASGGPLLVVDVAGKVRRPGLVRLPPGARVNDAIRAAGGALPGASTASLNLARRVADGEQVVVGSAAVAGGSAEGSGGLLDLNLASVQDLDGLPGIGPVLAERIVAWRTEHGRFASVDQLREVDGIGEAKFSSLRAKVTV